MDIADAKITAARFDAALFDMDGVITKTAVLHEAAWEQMFDEYLEQRRRSTPDPPPGAKAGSAGPAEDLEPFRGQGDYDTYLDGKPRYDGVRSFLASRHITLPDGAPTDPPTAETVCGLGNRKEQLFHVLLDDKGVEVYPGSIELLKAVRAEGVKTAIVSSSKNCLEIIRRVDIVDLFDARIDGHDVEEGGLAGKPAPDTYLAAAHRLGAEADRSVVFEDALAGVESGRNGHFGLVVGVDRVGQADALRAHGADVVVTDLADLIP